MSDSKAKAEAFIAVAAQFQLGSLPTEQRHPLTYELAELSRHDIPAALKILKEIDLGVIRDVIGKAPELKRLQAAIADTFAAGNRVFFYGCGATGRLSLSIEYIWRHMHRSDPAAANKVMGFMSGGDLALVHSIENFEDHPEFGARQLREIGFGPHDLLVSCTEGGETPSVIGATEEAARLSSRKPYFLYCNPSEALHEQVERSRLVLENAGIEKICLFVGPMALSGSTRMQASTALMLGAGAALFGDMSIMSQLLAFLQNTDISFLTGFIEEESRIYDAGDFLLYETREYGITILTDTTERSPTFSQRAFENQHDAHRRPALSFLCMPEAADAMAAWHSILLRDPVTIEWEELEPVAGMYRLTGFDFSAAAVPSREALVAPGKLHRFRVDRAGDEMVLELGKHRHSMNVNGLHPLAEHLFLKIVMNMHSTLVMGRLGRFESNVMTWVKPSNKKLIDRAIRYVEYLLHHRNIMGFSYADICHQLFAEAERMTPADSVVLMTVEALRQRSESGGR